MRRTRRNGEKMKSKMRNRQRKRIIYRVQFFLPSSRVNPSGNLWLYFFRFFYRQGEERNLIVNRKYPHSLVDRIKIWCLCINQADAWNRSIDLNFFQLNHDSLLFFNVIRNIFFLKILKKNVSIFIAHRKARKKSLFDNESTAVKRKWGKFPWTVNCPNDKWPREIDQNWLNMYDVWFHLSFDVLQNEQKHSTATTQKKNLCWVTIRFDWIRNFLGLHSTSSETLWRRENFANFVAGLSTSTSTRPHQRGGMNKEANEKPINYGQLESLINLIQFTVADRCTVLHLFFFFFALQPQLTTHSPILMH